MSRHRVTTIAERIEDALREIGVLLMAFAPLDAAFGTSQRTIGRSLLFFGAGLLLFAGALMLERSRARGP